ncbi:MAG: hypothetical protein HGA86_08450, partial [Anaerolineaceae bacterium]|nr:hypothetical protein [Anaerolineaceae bacterium]
MAHIKALTDLNLTDSWLSIGSFDGVHRGHQTLIRTMKDQAHRAGSQAVVITFFPHPLEVLRNSKDSFYLTSPEKRAQLLCSLGIDRIITVEFTKEIAEISADEFLQELKAHLGMT